MVENFNNLRNENNRICQERSQFSKQMVQTVHLCFCQHTTTFLRRAVRRLHIPYYVIQNIMNNLAHMLPYKIPKVHQINLQCYTYRVAISQSFRKERSSDSCFLCWFVTSNEYVFPVPWFDSTLNNCDWDTKDPRNIYKNKLNREKQLSGVLAWQRCDWSSSYK